MTGNKIILQTLSE